MRALKEGGLLAELLEPYRRSALPTERSQTRIRFDDKKVLDIRWGRAGSFKAIHFEPGEWVALIELPTSIPLD